MADLMSDRTVSYQALKKKYNDFLVPAARIKVMGKDIITELKLGVDDISVVQSLEGAGSCSFTIVNAYDLNSRQFDKRVKSKLQLGTILTLDMGYGSSLTTLFKGYISNISYRFHGAPEIEVTAMDVRRLMMDTTNSFRVLGGKTCSEVFTEVMSTYKKLCTNMSIDKTTDMLPEKVMTQNTSDYQFVDFVLSMRGQREFFVLGDKVYFRRPQKVKSPITTLTWGSSLLTFSRTSSYAFNEIQVLGKDEEGNVSVMAKGMIKATDPQSAVVSSPEPIIISDPFVTDKKRAEARLKAEIRRRTRESQRAEGSCVGMPEIVPGRYIKLEKLDSILDKKYYITRAAHNFYSGGYTTNFTVEGWE